MFLKKIQAQYEVNAAKIPSYTDEKYQKEFKFPKVSRNETATHSFGNNGAKIVISLFPDWTKEDHLAAAAKHEKDLAHRSSRLKLTLVGLDGFTRN